MLGETGETGETFSGKENKYFFPASWLGVGTPHLRARRTAGGRREIVIYGQGLLWRRDVTKS